MHRGAPEGGVGYLRCHTPLESLRTLLAILSREDPTGVADPMCLSLVDVSRAHFYADATREVFIRLPSEDPRAGEKDVCGRLKKTMYGTLDAADRWGEHYAKVLCDSGFIRGVASPCHFMHPKWNIHMIVHGDDFIFIGRKDGRARTIKLLEDHFEIKCNSAGPAKGMAHELKVLGRVATYHPWGVDFGGRSQFD